MRTAMTRPTRRRGVAAGKKGGFEESLRRTATLAAPTGRTGAVTTESTKSRHPPPRHRIVSNCGVDCRDNDGGCNDITSLQRPTTTISTTADHGQHRRKWSTCDPHEAFFHPTLFSSLDGGRPPELVEIIFRRLRGCVALKTLQCCGDASMPGQRSALRAMHPRTPPPQ